MRIRKGRGRKGGKQMEENGWREAWEVKENRERKDESPLSGLASEMSKCRTACYVI
jgi:squalene cyclase